MYSYIAKSVFIDHLGSSNDQCYIQNRVRKRLMCIYVAKIKADQLRGYHEVDLRLCFRICKKPVFLQRGSIENSIC